MIMDMKRAKAMAIGIAICFLAIHILIINVFQQCGVTPMVRFNIFSVIFYIVIAIVSWKGYLQVYCVAVYLEVALHMTLAVIFTGWESGFQITLIGMNVLAFYGEYVGRNLKIKYIKMLPFAILGMVLFIGSYIYIHFNPPAYKLSDKAAFSLTILWAATVFLITGFVLVMFLKIVASSEKQLEYQMSHDKLTGLPNRYYVADYMKEILEDRGKKEYWIAIADIDDFKQINDTYGHNCGDYVLSTLADIFKEKEEVLCCRWGGEEFIFISPIEDNAQAAFERLDMLRKVIENYQFHFEDYSFNVTMTFGMSILQAGLDNDAWISDADAKLYKGKMNGKNQVVW